MYGYIYKTTNRINGKVYIGQHKHSRYDEKYFGSGTLLKRAIAKYGIENFDNIMIDTCVSKDDMDKKEIKYIKEFNSTNNEKGYNLMTGGQGGDITGFLKESGTYEEWRSKFVGPNNPMYMSGILGKHPKGFKGHKRSQKFIAELRERMSKDETNPMRNGKVTWGVTHNHPRGMLGHKQTEHQKDVASKTHKGSKKPQSYSDKLSKRMKGVKKSKESVEKRRQTLLNKEPFIKSCVNCGKDYLTKSKTSMYCSNDCARKYRANLKK